MQISNQLTAETSSQIIPPPEAVDIEDSNTDAKSPPSNLSEPHVEPNIESLPTGHSQNKQATVLKEGAPAHREEALVLSQSEPLQPIADNEPISDEAKADARADMIAVLALTLLFIITSIYWLSQQS